MLAAAMAEAKRRSNARAWELHGNNLAVQEMTDTEIVLCGPAGTGKSLANLVKLHRMMSQYPGARALIVRKVRADLPQSTLVTYERDVLGQDNPICAGVTREGRDSYKYPNGSEVVVGGMDRPGRILSADYDLILAAETVQFTEADWETCIMRLRTGVLPYQQVLGDTNPDRPDHWLKQRADSGLLKLLNTTYRDNPRYWDSESNDWTARGRDYVVGKLGKLTGVRRLRYLDGKWIVAEGAVYDTWDENVHVVDAFDIPKSWTRIRAIDFGFVNPFVCLWIALDEDKRAYVYRQWYKTGMTVAKHAAVIRKYSEGETYEATVADHDAEDRATLRENGIRTIAAKKDISPGIQAVQERLQPAGDGRPRLYVLRGSLIEPDEALAESKAPVDIVGEFGGYIWTKTADGKPNKELPVDLNNHALDAVRYGVMYVDKQVKGRIRENPFY